MAIAIAMLLGVKIFLSGWYLTSVSRKIPVPGLVLAEENGATVKQEIPLDEKLRRKEKELREREELVKKRENELQLLQDKIDAKMSELNDLQTKLLNFSKKLAQREKALKDAQMNHLVALYSAMEPGKADHQRGIEQKQLTRISHGRSPVAADSPMSTALRLKNHFDVLREYAFIHFSSHALYPSTYPPPR